MVMGATAKGDTHYRGNAVLVEPFLSFSDGFFAFLRGKVGVTVCLAVFARSQNICARAIAVEWK